MSASLSNQLERGLATWLADPATAFDVRRVYARELNAAVARRCCELLAPHGGAGATELLAARGVDREAVEAATWSSPAVAFALYVGLAAETAHAHLEPALRALPNGGGDVAPDVVLDGTDRPEWLLHALGVFGDDLRREGMEADLRPAGFASDRIAECAAALDRLGTVWPEMGETCRLLIREVRWYTTADGAPPPFASGSLTQSWGAVYLAAPGNGVLGAIESLVHEATHLELTARMAIEPLIANRERRAVSQFRSKPRPLGRVVHATVVNVRLLHLWDRLAGTALGRSERAAVDARRGTYRRHLAVGLESLRTAAEWTPLGRELFRSLEAAPGS